MSLIAGRGCRWPSRRDSVSPCVPLSGGRDTHDGHENSPILVFFSNLLGAFGSGVVRRSVTLTQGAGRLLHQIGLDKAVEITIEHTVDVTDIHFRAVVLD